MSGHAASNLGAISEENELHSFQTKIRNIYTPHSMMFNEAADISDNVDFLRRGVKENEIEQVQRFAGIGIGFISLITENLISHPCTVLRRQCQVNRKALRYHLTPFTLLPVIVKLQRRQGFTSLWKGAGSIFIIRGLTVAVETGLAEFTPFPREVSQDSSIKHLVQHLALKSLTLLLLTPFTCASLAETVQSSIASEKPGVFECLKEGLCRIFRVGTPKSTRLLPIWLLVLPTVAHGLLHYMISSISQSVAMWFLSYTERRHLKRLGAVPKEGPTVNQYLNELTAACIGGMLADILLYPSETVIHRLYLQGTRSIIDNLDYGTSVTPVITKYEGPLDCFHTIVQEEGASGLYKGFGALLLQYGLNVAILKLTKIITTEISFLFKKAKGEHIR